MAILDEPKLSNATALNEHLDAFSFDEPASDDEAVALVLQNEQKARAFLATRLWLTEWRAAKAATYCR